MIYQELKGRKVKRVSPLLVSTSLVEPIAGVRVIFLCLSFSISSTTAERFATFNAFDNPGRSGCCITSILAVGESES
jgi:hypothetical protein